MALGLEGKKAIVAEVNEVAEGALSAVIADYRGVSVDEMTTLRKQARESNVYVRVVRNTLAKRAVVGTDFECMDEALVGPTILAFAHNEPGAAARLFKDFAKENSEFEIKAVSIGGKLLPADQIDTVAKLPTKDEAISMLMSLMTAPVTKLAQTFNEIPGKLVRTVSAVKDKKESEAS